MTAADTKPTGTTPTASAQRADAATGGTPGLVLGTGARVTEDALLETVARLVAAAREQPALLATPVRVVVSSRSLREHVIARIVKSCGAVVGVTVQTLQALAREALERAGQRFADGDALFPLLARRAVMTEPVLRALLADLDDGAGVAVGTIADLLDAGLTPEAAAAADESLAAHETAAGRPLQEIARARALVRAAAVVQHALAALGCLRSSGRLAQARECLAAGDASLLPARAILIHGFADATRLGLDLIETLVRLHGGTVFVDQPPDPASGQPDPAAARFTERLVQGLRALGPTERVASIEAFRAPVETIDLQAAPGADAEARAVATRIRTLIDDGTPVDEIGVVARRLDPSLIPLRRHFTRLGIAFSASAPAPPGAGERRIGAILRLLRDGNEATVDALLDAASIRMDLKSDLRVACHAVGAARVRDVATLDVATLVGVRGVLYLPVPRGRTAAADREAAADSGDASASETESDVDSVGDRPERLRPRAVRADELAALVTAARHIVDALGGDDAGRLREPASIAATLSQVFDALAIHGDADTALLDDVRAKIAGTMAALPKAVAPTFGEAVSLVESQLPLASRTPAGGAGLGVAVLDAMAARARTFSHLFVIGLNRDVFPRIVREDPLLPDALRGRTLGTAGFALARKDIGHDEERWLFASLLSAAPRITLSWQHAGDDGRPRPASPLLELLRVRCRDLPFVEAPSLRASLAEQGARPQTAHEHAVLAALHDGRETLEHTLPLALAEAAQGDIDTLRDARVAAAQRALLAEFDPPLRDERASGPGPWCGFIGVASRADDPRRGPFYVTRAESLARCGWRHFLERLLGLEPPPDALAALPEIDARIVGSAVHTVLEVWLSSLGVPTRQPLADIVRGTGVPLVWPDDAALQPLALSAARAALGPTADAWPGLVTALAERVAEAFHVLRNGDSTGHDARVIGAEIEGVCHVPGPGEDLLVRFRADLVTREGDSLVLVDLKTGKPGAKTTDKVLRALQQGALLQGAAYARAAGAADEMGGAAGLGRYLHVQPVLQTIELRAGDAAQGAAFDRVSSDISAAWQAGALLPRLIDETGHEPRACSHCDVADACVRGDSTARRRLAEWRDRVRNAPPATAAERAALAWLTPGATEPGA